MKILRVMCMLSFLISCCGLLSNKTFAADQQKCDAGKSWWPICNIANSNSLADTHKWIELFQSERKIYPAIKEQKKTLDTFKSKIDRGYYLYKNALLQCRGNWKDDTVRNCSRERMKLAADAGSADAAYEYSQLTMPSEESRKYLLLSAELGSYTGRLIVGGELIEDGKTTSERVLGIKYYESLALENREMIDSLIKYKPNVKNDIPHDHILVWELLGELNQQQADITTINNIRNQVEDWSIFCKSLANLARGAQVDSMPENNQSPEFVKQIVEITINCVEHTQK